MIKAEIQDGHVKCLCRGNRKALTMELVGIVQGIISGASDVSQSAAQKMKHDLCVALLRDMATVEIKDGSEIIVITDGSKERAEISNYRAVAEMARRARRENDRLREQLGQQTAARREFDRQDQEDFLLVRFNRARRPGEVKCV